MLGFGVPNTCEQQAPLAGEEVLRWRSHPLVDDYPKSILLAVAILGTCAAATLCFGGVTYGVLAALMLAVSLSRYLLPTEFVLDGQGVEACFLGQTQRMAWSQVRRVSVRAKGVYLSPQRAPSRLDSFRGVQLRFAKNNDEVVRFVESKVSTIS